ncbi:MAG: HAMP domain-containing sensor histidine kinase [Acidobacteriota bacterium]
MGDKHDNRANTDANDFVAMVVHQLRTPLTALRGSLGLLVDSVEEAAPDVRTFAAIADRNAARLARQLDDLADLCRLRDPAMTLDDERCDVADAVSRAVDLVLLRAVPPRAAVTVETSPAEATIDVALVRLAMIHLLSYAIGVSPATATVRVRVSPVAGAGRGSRRAVLAGRSGSIASRSASANRSDGERPGVSHPRVVITVLDGGPAVPANKARRMCEPFGETARRGGTDMAVPGLGLAIAARVATLHEGSLVFTSTDQGGLFSLTLPVR